MKNKVVVIAETNFVIQGLSLVEVDKLEELITSYVEKHKGNIGGGFIYAKESDYHFFHQFGIAVKGLWYWLKSDLKEISEIVFGDI